MLSSVWAVEAWQNESFDEIYCQLDGAISAIGEASKKKGK